MVYGGCLVLILNTFLLTACSQPCTKQPLSFGKNCSQICHCLGDVCDARVEGAGCLSGNCSPGYRNFPGCQERCGAGTFGVDCSSICYCEPQNICEPTNGNCIGENKCSSLRYGPGCQGARSRLLHSPTVFSNCSTITISWPDASPESYAGSLDVVSYSVQKKSSSDPIFVEVHSVSRKSNSNIHFAVFVPFNASEEFTFKVRPDFLVSIPPDNYVETGVASPPSEAVKVKCQALAGFSVSTSGSQVTASWARDNVPGIQSVRISSLLLQIGDCNAPSTGNSGTVTIEQRFDQLSATYSLDYWRQYSVSAYGLVGYTVSTASSTSTVWTGEGTPRGQPQHMRIVGELKRTTANINWDPPPCEQRQGYLKRYVILISPSVGVRLSSSDPVTAAPPLNLSGLSPQTTYTLLVRYENSVGAGPPAELTFTTMNSVPSPSLGIFGLTSDSAILTWTNVDGSFVAEAVGFQLVYWMSVSKLSPTGTSVLPVDTVQYLITGLRPDTEYQAQVFLILVDSTRVGSQVVTFRTRPLASAQPLTVHLLGRTSSSIDVAWSKVTDNIGHPEVYLMTIDLVQSKLPVPPLFVRKLHMVSNTAQSRYTFDHLPASSQFTILFYKGNRSDPDALTASLNAWTKPESFVSSSDLKIGDFKIIAESASMVTVRFPSVDGYKGGPLNDFIVAVVKAPPKFTGSSKLNTSSNARASFPVLESQFLPNARIVYRSTTLPLNPITVGSGIVTVEPNTAFDTSNKTVYNNPALLPNSTYLIYAIVQSTVDGASEGVMAGTIVLYTAISPISASLAVAYSKSSDSALAGWIVGVFFILLAMLTAVLLTYYYFCRSGAKHGNYLVTKFPFTSGSAPARVDNERSFSLPHSYAWWSVPVDPREPRYLILDPETGAKSTLLGTWSKKELADTYALEYASIPIGSKFPCVAGESQLNLPKNRSQSALPYDQSRVILKRPADSAETDYINAAFVDGYMRRKAYIASQSPFDTSTSTDFWLMVFQRNVAQIVMLTNLVEDSTLKCCQYWPDVTSRTGTTTDSTPSTTRATQRFGNLLVQAIDRVSYAHFTVRYFTVTEMTTGVIQQVVQYHFHSWVSPEERLASNHWGSEETIKQLGPSSGGGDLHFSAPGLYTKSSPIGSQFDRLAFIEFYYRVKTASRPEDGPVVVHCGTGFARTALYIAFDTLLQQATHERVVSTARVCSSLCKSRPNMFRSLRHYILLYDLLYEAILAGHCIVDLDVLSTYRMLCQKNPKFGRTYLWEQWSLLDLYTPTPPADPDLRMALSAQNLSRNRFPKDFGLLPPERYRPHLRGQLQTANWNGYINAVYLDGAALRDDIILTQTPSAKTVDEFWLLVDEERVSCIIDMQPSCYGTEEAIRYWPLNPGEENSRPLFDDPSNAKGDRIPNSADSDAISSTRGPWCTMCCGRLQVCQVGSLTPVRLDLLLKRRTNNYKILRRRLLVRQRQESLPNGIQNHGKRHRTRELLIFHFASEWDNVNEVPESRVAFVRLLEAIRLERGTGPLLVHCLNGATRSGLLAVCHLLAERLTRDHYVDLFHVLKAVKIRRHAVIGSQEQLRFVYRLMIQWIKQTLAEPLAAWTARYLGDIGEPTTKRNWQWPQLVGHLPPHERVGIFSHAQLPALVADHNTVEIRGEERGEEPSNLAGMLNMSNSSTSQLMTEVQAQLEQDSGVSRKLPVSVLYRYFTDELLSGRANYSRKSIPDDKSGLVGDVVDVGSWSTVGLH
ncbi:unnamed protein product [Calicophoron daubneyi]|uniref:protein-tyrosine-phosphatase n=1 Tax=Calicophoron daubneyi TaxID=300641 RepID=A0AAV2TP03_CALDB